MSEKGKEKQRHDEGVSPVIGIVLMVAIVVVLSMVIGVFVMDLTGSLDGSQSTNLAVQFNEKAEDGLQVTFMNSVDKDITIKYPGGKKIVSNPNVGQTVTIHVWKGDTVNIISGDSVIQTYKAKRNNALVAYYPLDGSKDAERGPELNVVNGDPVPTTGIHGGSGNAMYFTKEAYYRSTKSPLGFQEETDSFAVAAWFKTTNTTEQRLVDIWASSGSNDYFDMKVKSGGTLKGQYLDHEGDFKNFPSGKYVSDGEWHHAILAIHNGTAKLYLDGERVATTTDGLPGTFRFHEPSGGLGIAAQSASTPYSFEGSMAHVRIIKGNVTDEQAKEIYQKNK